MAYLVERMEKWLRLWEDFWFLIKSLNVVTAHNGKPRIIKDNLFDELSLRKKLLKIRQTPVDICKFLPPREWEISEYELTDLPHFIIPWSLHSRRIYAIDEDLQAVLGATSLEGVTWRDIVFPFPSYAVRLQQPLITEQGKYFDFVVISALPLENDSGQVLPSIRLAFLPKDCDSYEPLSEANRQSIRSRMQNYQWDQVGKTCFRFLERCQFPFVHISLIDDQLDLLVTSSAQQICDSKKRSQRLSLAEYYGEMGSPTFWDSMLRIVAGMCLYLKTLPPQSPHQSEWRPVPRSGLPDPRAISNEAQVCTVSSCYKLTTEERVVLGLEGTKEQRAAYELSCHFRQGHWRRPPGYGHLPDAPKTVHVRPCLVRKDRLREGELPGGSQALV